MKIVTLNRLTQYHKKLKAEFGSLATQSKAGLMSATDKIKLDGVASGANKTVVDTALSTSSTNPVQNKVLTNAINNRIGKNPIPINANADLNTILETGYYTCPATSNATTVKNCPLKEAFFLEVVKNQESTSNTSSSYNQFKQIITAYDRTNPRMFVRTIYQGTFGQWYEFVYSNNAIKSITSSNATITTTTASGRQQSLTINNVAKASSADKLTTPRSISVSGGAKSDPISFDGSQNISIPITKFKEGMLEWGGANFSGSYGCIDAAMVPQLGANRLAFGKAAGIIVEYSRDSGATWQDYGLNDTQKVSLFGAGATTTINIGKSSKGQATNKCMLRITIDTDKFGIYTFLHKFVLYISVGGSQSCWCTIDGSLESTPNTYKVFADKIPISGWSGYNVINIDGFTTYGNSSPYQYGKFRFTFGCGATNTTYENLSVYKIMGFGGVGWHTPSQMAKDGHLYTYDNSQNARFPADVTATKFNGLATKAERDGREQIISSTYIKGLSVNGRNITYTKGDGTTGTITTQDTNTTYGVASQSANGLMSASDKKKLDNIADGAGKVLLKLW